MPLLDNHGNELLKLSRSVNNNELTTLLLSFPAVRRVEMSNPLNLPVELSKESAMRSFTDDEEYLLSHVINHYKEKMDDMEGYRRFCGGSFINYLAQSYS